MFLISQKGEAKIVTEESDAKVKENIAGRQVLVEGLWMVDGKDDE